MRGEDIVATARTWMGTPYRHQGRVKGEAVDCLGLIAGVAKELGIFLYDHTNYRPQPDGVMLKKECDRMLVPSHGLWPGSVMLLWVAHRALPQHMAIVTRLADGRPGMVHAIQTLGRVTEHGIDDFWLRRLVQTYKYPGVE